MTHTDTIEQSGLIWKQHRTGLRANTGRKGYFVIEPIADGQYVVKLRGRKIGQQYADIEGAKALAEDQLAVMIMTGVDVPAYWRDHDAAKKLLLDMAMADTGLYDDPEGAVEVWNRMLAEDDIPGHRG
jgi:hypothetical protein